MITALNIVSPLKMALKKPLTTIGIQNGLGADLFFFIVIRLQLSAFSPHPSTPPQPNPPPFPTSTLPLDFVHVSFIVVAVIPSPHDPFPHG